MINMPSLKRPFYAVWLSLFLVNVVQADTIRLVLFNKTNEDIMLTDRKVLHEGLSTRNQSHNVALYKNSWVQTDFDMNFIPVYYKNPQTMSFTRERFAKGCIAMTIQSKTDNRGRPFQFCLKQKIVKQKVAAQIMGYIAINDCYQPINVVRPESDTITIQLQLNKKGKTFFISHPQKLKSGLNNDLGMVMYPGFYKQLTRLETEAEACMDIAGVNLPSGGLKRHS